MDRTQSRKMHRMHSTLGPARLEPLERRQLLSAAANLSDLTPSFVLGGFGELEIDQSNGGSQHGDGQEMRIGDVSYKKGLGTHAGSDVRYNLDGRYHTFVASIGIDEEVGDSGSVTFQVWGDGHLLLDSGLMTGVDGPRRISVDVNGINELRLVVTDGGDGNTNDHADWAGAGIIWEQSQGTGLRGEYFSRGDLTGRMQARVDPTISFTWGGGEVGFSGGNDNVSARWSGHVEALSDGAYTFYTTSDDGVRLFIDDKLIINRWDNHPATEDRAIVTLATGLHRIKLEYFEGVGNATAKLDWSGPNLSRQAIAAQSTYAADGPGETPDPTPPADQQPNNPPVQSIDGAIVVGPNEAVKSIQQAINMAKPGQSIVIRNGTYREAITITRSGRQGQPILISAETAGGVVIDASGKNFGIDGARASFITLRGVRIINANSGLQNNAALRTGANWLVEDVSVERAAVCGIYVGGANSTFIRTYARDCGQQGWWVNANNIMLKDSGATGNNTKKYNAAWEAGGVKFYITDGCIVDGGVWANNGGPAIWFDYRNRNFIVKNTEVFGNHGWHQGWAGVGLVSEISDGPGLFAENFIHDNTGDGIAMWETLNTTVQNNTLVRDNIGFRDLTYRSPYRTRNNKVINNSLEQGQVGNPPGNANNVIVGNH